MMAYPALKQPIEAVVSIEKLTSRSEHHHKHFLESGILLLSFKVEAMNVCKLVTS